MTVDAAEYQVRLGKYAEIVRAESCMDAIQKVMARFPDPSLIQSIHAVELEPNDDC